MPYIFVPSRAELGAAGNTKRPTSVVMVAPAARAGAKKKKAAVDEKEVDEGEFAEVYAELVRVITKASRDVRI